MDFGLILDIELQVEVDVAEIESVSIEDGNLVSLHRSPDAVNLSGRLENKLVSVLVSTFCLLHF